MLGQIKFKVFSKGVNRNKLWKVGAVFPDPFRGLIEKIDIYWDEVVQLAAKTSFAAQKVIATSTKLDRILSEYTQYKKKAAVSF